MGNSSSSGRAQDETVDGGVLFPQGVYTGGHDWNQDVVARLIVSRKLAPFYRPLEDYEPTWDDQQILAARKAPMVTPSDDAHSEPPPPPSVPSGKSSSHSKRPTPPKEISPAAIYKGAVECPICFLYYPPNINYSRCCDQAICTECFVQIKRSEPTTTHIVSDPAACPYCVQDNFGVVYKPPSWRLGIGSEGLPSPYAESSGKASPQFLPDPPTHKRRQKSFGADSPEVVTTDQIRPDWEAKLTAVKAAVARRANRRIIMRQVGDRLIPVGVTSGRIHALSPEEAAAAEAAEEGGSSRRSRRRQQGTPGGEFMGMAGQDLDELMMMEAMRLSLLDHEEHQRKQAEEERKKKGKRTSTTADSAGSAPVSSSVPSSSAIPPPASSTAAHGRNMSSSFNPSSSSRPFSTLTAALSAASTASALLQPANPSRSQPEVSTEVAEAPATDFPPMSAMSSLNLGGVTSPRPITTRQDSTSDSILTATTTSTTKAYDELPSSVESLAQDKEPLLPSDSALPTSPAAASSASSPHTL